MEEARLLDEKPVFLASSLIDAAVRSGREKDLLDRVVQRDAHAKKMVSLVFRTHLAMAKKDFPEAKKLLEECREQFDAEVPRWDIEAACYAAIPALRSTSYAKQPAHPGHSIRTRKTTVSTPPPISSYSNSAAQIQAYLDEQKNALILDKARRTPKLAYVVLGVLFAEGIH